MNTRILVSSINEEAQLFSWSNHRRRNNPDDINLYRNLSGGVPHTNSPRSANPIGGRSAIIKRWEKVQKVYYTKEPILLQICAWGKCKTIELEQLCAFPQTRMGVEQVFVDYFQRAKEYQQEWKAYNALPRKVKARTCSLWLKWKPWWKFNGELYFCHSYVQSEINMLMKVAERFGVTINTFTPILEL